MDNNNLVIIGDKLPTRFEVVLSILNGQTHARPEAEKTGKRIGHVSKALLTLFKR